MMTAKMSQLQKAIANPGIEFVSFSVDPDHDTPQVLKQYAKMWKADDRWHFLSTDAENLAKTAAGMKTFVRPPEKDQPIQHSSIFILTDDHGNVRGVYDSSDSTAMQRLTIDALTLAGTPPPANSIAAAPAWTLPSGHTTGASPGETLFIRAAAWHVIRKAASLHRLKAAMAAPSLSTMVPPRWRMKRISANPSLTPTQKSSPAIPI